MIEDSELPEIEEAPAAVAITELAAPQVPAEPLVALAAYVELRQCKKWMVAALRTKCPIEQHMRHGRDPDHHAEYLANTDAHAKTVGAWDKHAHDITHGTAGSL